jgi:hypothetical protein
MTETADKDVTFRADYRADPRLERLLGPGGPFETEDLVLDGRYGNSS